MASTSVVFDILAKDRASDKFAKVGNSADRSSSKLSKFGAVAANAGKAAAFGLGAGLVFAAGAAFKMTQAAAEDAQAQELLAGALQRNAGATDEQVAAVERWISAQGRAKGVADDELRPALGALITATNDVSKAQDLASLAMDVSAARGKSLQSVSEALMKAQNGQISGLSRLGINTKNAAGETIAFEEAVRRMTDQFGGAASEKAQTFQGKVDRIKLALSEAGESIGSKLLPYAEQFTDWITGTAVPRIEKFVEQMDKGKGAGGRFADQLREIRDRLKRATEFVVTHKDEVAKLIIAYGGVRTAIKLITGAQLLLNLAMAANPAGLLLGAIAALAGGFFYAYNKSERFREAVHKLSSLFIRITGNAVSFAVSIKEKVVGALVGALSAPADLARAFVTAMGTIRGVLSTVGAAIDTVRDKISGLLSALQGAAGASFPGAGALGGLVPRAVAGSGGGGGLASGITKTVNKISEEWKQILRDQLEAARDALAALREERTDTLAALDQQKADFANFASFGGNAFGADLASPDGTGQLQGGSAVAAILAFQAQKAAEAERLSENVATLIGKGLSDELIEEMKAQGNAGIQQINALAEFATPADIAKLNADAAREAAELQSAGLAAASELFNDTIATTTAMYDAQIRTMGAAVSELSRQVGAVVNKPAEPVELHLHLGGNTIVKQIRREERADGKQYLVSVP